MPRDGTSPSRLTWARAGSGRADLGLGRRAQAGDPLFHLVTAKRLPTRTTHPTAMQAHAASLLRTIRRELHEMALQRHFPPARWRGRSTRRGVWEIERPTSR